MVDSSVDRTYVSCMKNRTDSERFTFLNENWSNDIDGQRVHAWLTAHRLAFGSIAKAVDFLMDQVDEAEVKRPT